VYNVVCKLYSFAKVFQCKYDAQNHVDYDFKWFSMYGESEATYSPVMCMSTTSVG
jgi:hypothetical protein